MGIVEKLEPQVEVLLGTNEIAKPKARDGLQLMYRLEIDPTALSKAKLERPVGKCGGR